MVPRVKNQEEPSESEQEREQTSDPPDKTPVTPPSNPTFPQHPFLLEWRIANGLSHSSLFPIQADRSPSTLPDPVVPSP
ncbi:hypothetical protein VTJ04DRAFT_8112 [Mycothermus thermophilus]|uniref:uncharacterized protein n=1 Tax=Humicola insolens TaxID=85995 RepID=UPI0037443A02